MSLTVTGGVSVTYRICADEPVVFAAGQDGSGDFQPLTIADGTVTFDVTSGRGALAYVTQADAVTYTTRILYWTASELNHSATPCVSPSIPGTKTLTGGFANFGDGNYAEVAIGGAYQYGSPQSPSFSMSNVTDGPTDAIAFLFNFSGGPFSADRGIIRRGVNYTGTVPVFDFAAPESFATVPRSLTINNVGTDLLAWVTVDFQTQRGVAAFLYNEFETRTTATRQVPTVPNPQPGDLHSVAVRAVDEGMECQVWKYFAEGADQTVTLGPVPSPVTVTEVASGPSKRLRVQYAVQSEYDRRHFGFFTQGSRTLIVNISQAYLGGSNVDYTIPDLTGVTGFPAAAAFGPGPVDWQAGGFEYTGDATPADGEVIKLFWRYGSI